MLFIYCIPQTVIHLLKYEISFSIMVLLQRKQEQEGLDL